MNIPGLLLINTKMKFKRSTFSFLVFFGLVSCHRDAQKQVSLIQFKHFQHTDLLWDLAASTYASVVALWSASLHYAFDTNSTNLNGVWSEVEARIAPFKRTITIELPLEKIKCVFFYANYHLGMVSIQSHLTNH